MLLPQKQKEEILLRKETKLVVAIETRGQVQTVTLDTEEGCYQQKMDVEMCKKLKHEADTEKKVRRVVGMETKDAGTAATHQYGAECPENEADQEALHPRPPRQRRRLIGSLQRRCHCDYHDAFQLQTFQQIRSDTWTGTTYPLHNTMTILKHQIIQICVSVFNRPHWKKKKRCIIHFSKTYFEFHHC